MADKGRAPPVWRDGKTYEIYRKELHLWEFSCAGVLAKNKQATQVLLSLPDCDELGIKTKLLESISIEDLTSDDGMKKIKEFLDKLLGKDELDDMLQKMEDFDNYSKAPDEGVNAYIMNFEQKYGRIKSEITLPEKYLAFRLLGRANLTSEERVLVIAPIDYSKADSLLAQMKASLKKVLGGGCSGGAYTGSTGVSGGPNVPLIKTEPTFYNDNRGRGGRGSRGYGRGNRGYGRGYGRGNGNYGSASNADTRKTQNLNPVLRDGSRMKCFRCGSTEHLIGKCTNMKYANKTDFTEEDEDDAKLATEENDVYLTQTLPWYSIDKVIESTGNEENVVLFTGNLILENVLLNKEALTSAVLDSACSSNVCGSSWMNNYLSSLNDVQMKSVVNKPSHRVFRFGGEALYRSVGNCIIPAQLAGTNISIQTDVVESEIPLLLSRKTLKKMKAEINYANDTAIMLDKKVNLSLTSSGHHCVNILPESEFVSVHAVVLQDLDDASLLKAIQRIHRQFGHPSKERLITLLKDAGVWKDGYREVVSGIYNKCEICHIYARTPPRPIVALPMAREFNETVSMDLKYWKKGLWILHLIDLFSRYTMSEFITRKTPDEVINVIMGCWVAIFGVMRSVLSDNGGEFSSDETRDVASVLDWKVCTTAAESPFQNGLCERNHAVCDNILSKLQAQYPKTSLQVLLKWANMAKNSLAMWNGFSSNQIVFGKNPNLPNIMIDKLPALEGVTESKALALHLNALHTAREEFIKSEADEKIRRALKHKIRTSEDFFKKGDKVFYKRENQERWMGPATVMCQDGKVIFARHGGQLVRLSPNRVTRSNPVPDDEDSGRFLELQKDGVGVVNERPVEAMNERPVVPAVGEIPTLPAAVIDEPEKLPDEIVTAAGNNDSERDVEQPVRRSLRLFNQETGVNVYMVTIPKSQHNTEDCIAAKCKELDKLSMFDVHEVVPNVGQHAISTRWILWKKGEEIRARLVARGFEEDVSLGIDSPTVGKGMVRLVLTLAASFNWLVKTTDIRSAFLQGLPLERDVYLVPPPEAQVEDNGLWKLKKCLYGLSDAARRFYDCVVEELLNCGCEKASFDPSFFIKRNSNKQLIGVLATHIDDFLHAGTEEFEVKVINKLCERFLSGKQKKSQFKYVGYQVTQASNGILLDQTDYVENVEVRQLSAEREMQQSDIMTAREMTNYRSMVGSLNWIVQGTRPDLAFMLTDLSTKFKNGKVQDYVMAKKMLIKAKASTCSILFPSLGNPDGWFIAVWTDASYGNLNEGVNSCMGYLVFLVNKEHHSCPLIWRSGKIKRVVRSTIAAETLALVEGLEEGIYVCHTVKELLSVKLPIVAFTDHLGLTEAIRSTKLADDRRLRIDIAAVKEMLKDGFVQEVRYCPTGQQLADSLTKKTADNKKLLYCLQNGLFNLEC